LQTKPLGIGTLVVLFCAVIVGCDGFSEQPTGTPPVVELMPDLAGYSIIEGTNVQEYIAALAEGAALLSGNPEMVPLIAKVDGTISCYQDAGAVNLRIYSRQDFPLSAGAIAIADRNRLTDPAVLLRCAGAGMGLSADEPKLDPCGHSYTLAQDGNEFYFVYVGTTAEICQTFCANLKGCSGH
jgi:hypothetical protein